MTIHPSKTKYLLLSATAAISLTAGVPFASFGAHFADGLRLLKAARRYWWFVLQ